MDKTYNNITFGFFSSIKLLDFDNAQIDMDFQNALIEIDFENAFNNTDCPLSLEQSESTDYVNNQYGNKEVRYDG